MITIKKVAQWIMINIGGKPGCYIYLQYALPFKWFPKLTIEGLKYPEIVFRYLWFGLDVTYSYSLQHKKQEGDLIWSKICFGHYWSIWKEKTIFIIPEIGKRYLNSPILPFYWFFRFFYWDFRIANS